MDFSILFPDWQGHWTSLGASGSTEHVVFAQIQYEKPKGPCQGATLPLHVYVSQPSEWHCEHQHLKQDSFTHLIHWECLWCTRKSATLWGLKNKTMASAFKKLMVLGKMERQLQQSRIRARIPMRAHRPKEQSRRPLSQAGRPLEETRFKFSRTSGN